MAGDSVEDGGNAWQRTMAELWRLESELEEDGWSVAAIPAGHIAPVPPEAGERGRFGLVHVVPGDEAEAFESAYEAGSFAEFEVYRRRVGHRLFLLTKLTAPDEQVAILLAGSVDTTQAAGLLKAAEERGEVYTHVQLLDGTHLGSFYHDDPSLFFPSLDPSPDAESSSGDS